MDARLNLFENTVAMNFAKYINSAGGVTTDSTLPAAPQELERHHQVGGGRVGNTDEGGNR